MATLSFLTGGILGGSAGLAADGMFGMGGGGGAPGGVGATCASVGSAVRLWWALDVDLAGVTYHFATSDVEVDGVTYESGLSELTLSRIVTLDNATIGATITTGHDWAAIFAAVQWLIDGYAATLWLVVEEGGARRRIRWLTGTAGIRSWNRRGQPVAIDIRGNAVSRSLLNERARIDAYTSPTDDSGLPTPVNPYAIFRPHQGLYYPLVIGYPGFDSATGTVYPLVPAPVIQGSTVFLDAVEGDPGPPLVLPERAVNVPGHAICVVAGHRIESGKAWVIELGVRPFDDEADGEPLDPDPFAPLVYTARDLLEQPFTYFVQEAGSRLFEGDTWTPYIALSPPGDYGDGFDADYGGGLMWRGRLLRGAADLFEWAIGEYTTHRIDVGRHAANAAALNRYRFDTFVNEPILATEWLANVVLEHLPARIVQGDDGIYLAHIPTQVRPGALTAAIAESVGAELEAAVESTADTEIVNELTYRWAPHRDLSSFYQTRILTSEWQRPVPVPGSDASYSDTRAYPTSLAQRSQNAYGVRPGSLDLGHVWDAGTAYQIAADYIEARAFPTRRFTYSLPVAYWRLMPGEIVQLTDEDMAISAAPCVIEDVRIGTTRVSVVLRPLRQAERYL